MADAKKVSLTISERIIAVTFLNNCKVNTETLAQILDDIKVVGLSEEDREACDWEENKGVDEKTGKEVVTGYTWSDEKGGVKEVELQDKTLEYLRKTIQEKDDAGEFTVQDRAVVQLKDKIK